MVYTCVVMHFVCLNSSMVCTLEQTIYFHSYMYAHLHAVVAD